MSSKLNKKGVYLAFVPIVTPSGIVESFELFLVNAAEQYWNYYIEQRVDGEDFYAYEGALPIGQAVDIEIVALFDLNHASTIELTLSDLEGNENEYNFSPKPNKLFKKSQYVDVLEKEAYCIEVYTIQEGSNKRKESPKPVKEEKVDHEIIEQLKESWSRKSAPVTRVRMSAPVGNEVDLHIEAFYKDWKNLNPEEILPMQMDYMDQCLDNAIGNNAYQITFIHGIGNGILKKAIFAALENNPHVRSFENRFDSRYGFGATEVLLK